MKRLTFADRVAVYLDQYKAASTGGKFISVDPDGDGKKQAIYVTNDGEVNPESESPGYWKDFKQKGPTSTGKKQHKDSPGQLGTHEDPFTGKYTRKPEKQQRLDDSTPEPDFVPDWVTEDDTVEEKKPTRLARGFKDAAKQLALGDDATKEELAELQKFAEEVVAERSQEIQAGADALRQVFGDGPSLTGAQSQARAASDVDQIIGFDEAVAEIESSGGWKNDQSLLHDIVAYMPGGKIKWAAGADGKIPAEQIVFEALRMPLPKPPKLSEKDVISEAWQRMSGSDKAEDRDAETRQRDALYNDLMNQANAAANEDDWDTYDELKNRIAEEFPETVEETADVFSAMTFREAVQRYAGQLGLFDDPFTGKFKKKPQKQGKLFDGGGKSWNEQPRVEKGKKEGGQWTKGNSPTSKSMDKAREKFLEKHSPSMVQEQKKTIDSVIKKNGGKEALLKQKPFEQTQQQYLLAQTIRLQKLRQTVLNGRSEAAKKIRELKNAEGKTQMRDVRNALELPGGQEMFEKLNLKSNYGEGAKSMHLRGVSAAFSFLNQPMGDWEKQNFSKLSWMLSAFGQAGTISALKKHREAVRRALKAGKAVPEGAYSNYHDADWQPGDQEKTPKASMSFCKELDRVKKTNKFRVDASVGRKLRTEANAAINKFRKQYVTKSKAIGEKIDAKQTEMDEILLDGATGRIASDVASREHTRASKEKWGLEKEAETLLLETIAKMPSKPVRKSTDKPGLVCTKKEPIGKYQEDKLNEAINFLEEISGNAMPNVRFELKKTTEDRSYHDTGNLYMNPYQMQKSVLAHELGHAIDYHSDQGTKTKAFEAQAIQKHASRWSGKGTKPYEVGSKNGFLEAYSGKYYARAKASEVLAMGIQHLIEEPARFADESPDHFNFTLASLRGLL